MLRDALRIGSVSGLSLQRTRCYSAVVVILSVTRAVWGVRLAHEVFSKIAYPVGTCRFLVASACPRNPVRNRSGQARNRDCVRWQQNHLYERRAFAGIEDNRKSDQVGIEIGFHVQRFGRNRNGGF